LLRDTGPAEQASNDPPFAGHRGDSRQLRRDAGLTRTNEAHTPTTFEHSVKSVNGIPRPRLWPKPLVSPAMAWNLSGH